MQKDTSGIAVAETMIPETRVIRRVQANFIGGFILGIGLGVLIALLLINKGRPPEPPPGSLGHLGLVSSPFHWQDKDRATMRRWRPINNEVHWTEFTAGKLSEAMPMSGGTCEVHNSAVLRIEAAFRRYWLVSLVRYEEPRAARQESDCELGSQLLLDKWRWNVLAENWFEYRRLAQE